MFCALLRFTAQKIDPRSSTLRIPAKMSPREIRAYVDGRRVSTGVLLDDGTLLQVYPRQRGKPLVFESLNDWADPLWERWTDIVFIGENIEIMRQIRYTTDIVAAAPSERDKPRGGCLAATCEIIEGIAFSVFLMCVFFTMTHLFKENGFTLPLLKL